LPVSTLPQKPEFKLATQEGLERHKILIFLSLLYIYYLACLSPRRSFSKILHIKKFPVTFVLSGRFIIEINKKGNT
jgi:hypothetical protein